MMIEKQKKKRKERTRRQYLERERASIRETKNER